MLKIYATLIKKNLKSMQCFIDYNFLEITPPARHSALTIFVQRSQLSRDIAPPL